MEEEEIAEAVSRELEEGISMARASGVKCGNPDSFSITTKEKTTHYPYPHHEDNT